ncbi:unnamed protein product, partial [marine sediment metagenome]
MQKGRGFFRLVMVISFLVFIIMSFYIFFELEKAFETEELKRIYELKRAYKVELKRKRESPTKKPESFHEKYGIALPDIDTIIIPEDSPTDVHIILGMVGGAASVIAIWLIYGLTIYVVRGFMGKEKRGENE